MSIVIRRLKDCEIITCNPERRKRTASVVSNVPSSKKRDVLEVISRRKEYSKVQYRLLNIPDAKRKTSVIGNLPLEFLQPNKAVERPYVHKTTFQMINQMKGIIIEDTDKKGQSKDEIEFTQVR